MKYCILSILFLFLSLTVFSQQNSHQLNNPLYRNIIKDNLKVTDKNLNDVMLIDNLLITLRRDKNLPESLRNYSESDLPEEKTAKEIIDEYNYLLSEIRTESALIKAEVDERLERQIPAVIERVDRELRKANADYNKFSNNKYVKQGKEVLKVYSTEEIKRKKEEAIEAERRKAEIELKSRIREMLTKKKDRQIAENSSKMEQYIKAAAFTANEIDEQKYIEKYNYHNCCIDYISSNFSISSSNWVTPDCNYPGPGNNTSQNLLSDNLAVAKRKIKLYETFNKDVLKDAAMHYLKMAIIDEKENLEALILSARLADKAMDKYLYIRAANSIEHNNEFSNELAKYKRNFIIDLKKAIDMSDVQFLEEAAGKDIINSVEIEGLSPLEYSVTIDNKVIMSHLLNGPNKYIDKDLLQVTAIMSGSTACLDELANTYRVNPGITLNSDGMTLLNLAYEYGNTNIIGNYIEPGIVQKALVYASEYTPKERLIDLCDHIYEYDNTTIGIISHINPEYNSTTYIIEVNTPGNDDASIYYGDKLIGKGKAEFSLRDITKAKDILIEATNKCPEKITADDIAGKVTEGYNTLSVMLVDNLTLPVSYYDAFKGKKTKNDFYVNPVLLKEYRNIGTRNGVLWLLSAAVGLGAMQAGLAADEPALFVGGLVGFSGFTVGSMFAFASGKKQPISSNISENKKRKKTANSKASSEAIKYNNSILKSLNDQVQRRNQQLLAQRGITLTTPAGTESMIVTTIDSSYFVSSLSGLTKHEMEIKYQTTGVKNGMAAIDPSSIDYLNIFEGVGELIVEESSYSDVITEFGEPYEKDRSRDYIYMEYKPGVRIAVDKKTMIISYIVVRKGYEGRSPEGINLGMSKETFENIMNEKGYTKVEERDWWRNGKGGTISVGWTYQGDKLESIQIL